MDFSRNNMAIASVIYCIAFNNPVLISSQEQSP